MTSMVKVKICFYIRVGLRGFRLNVLKYIKMFESKCNISMNERLYSY